MPEQTQDQPRDDQSSGQAVRLVVTWLVVTVPLGYGLYQTIKGVVPLFTG